MMEGSPLTTSKLLQLLRVGLKSTVQASHKIIEVYNSHFDVEFKHDDSPVTIADKEADRIIRLNLEPEGFYVLSEEVPAWPFNKRKGLNHLWIVDPLDGTREFIKRNGEFTTNIALIENGRPVLGVICAPAQNLVYFGVQGIGAFKTSLEHITGETTVDPFQSAAPLPLVTKPGPLRIIGSRSHFNTETRRFIDTLISRNPQAEIITSGSSIKLCKIAEGSADIYPRFSPISEWDVAAGDAIIRAAGGVVIDPDTRNELRYNKPDLHQYPFIAMMKPDLLNH